ncbi:MAG: hypothetical protein HMLKMBBP_01432 [Planctomycetes bacterium]|nr:hypothetical protein [Planctomycetota bacterium]
MTPKSLRTPLMLAALAAASMVPAACGGDDVKPRAAKPAADPAAAPADAGGAAGANAYDKAKGTASLTIKAKYGGAAAPAAAFYSMATSECSGHSGKARKEENEVNADGTVPHCFVWVVDGPVKGLKGFDAVDVKITQQGCLYIPHVFGVKTNDKLEVSNGDAFNHNVHVKPAVNQEKNIPQSAGAKDTFTFKKKEMAMPFSCDIHGWMYAWCFVMDHPFFGTTTRETGSTTISGLYPGKYTLKLWHETWAGTGSEQTIEVEVKDGANTHEVKVGK